MNGWIDEWIEFIVLSVVYVSFNSFVVTGKR